MQITVNLPDELALRLQNYQQQLPEILELGLREFNANAQMGFEGMAEVLEFLAQLPTPEEILALRPSQQLQAQIDRLLEKNRTTGLTATEEQHWEQYQYLEHLVRVAKAEAHLKLKQS
ncbi:MAG: hypothetical protein AB4426_33180 [Xenococcaceae cyanobacterium]